MKTNPNFIVASGFLSNGKKRYFVVNMTSYEIEFDDSSIMRCLDYIQSKRINIQENA